jgi:S1-C subfamily serine protease
MKLRLLLILSITFTTAHVIKHESKPIESLLHTVIKEDEPAHTNFLLSSARIKSDGGIGSASIIYSRSYGGKATTYFLTNYHVISEANTIVIETFDYNNNKDIVGVYQVEAKIIAHDVRRDLALLVSMNRNIIYKNIASLFPELDKDDEIAIMDEVHVVGSALGKNPIITTGIINNFNADISDCSMWGTTANIIYGNSGGGVFKWSDARNQYELIGVPTSVPNALGFPITHMGAFVPYTEIYKFLRESNHNFIIDKK